jgi:putative phosphoserine phosphatase/1-acylglycerol-3-phosphate O-acyltransferase
VRAPEALLAAIADAPHGPETGAFFDFDGTIIDGYSAEVVYRDRLRRLDIGPEELARTVVAAADMAARGAGVGGLVGAALGGLRGRTDADMRRFGERLWRQHIAGMVYPAARQLIRAHRRAGHTVVIATSATRYQVEPAADDLEVDELLCTEPEVGADGVLTGETEGPVLWGPNKAAAVEACAERRGIDLVASFAYGNGDEDEDLLSVVGRPVALNPHGGLSRIATSFEWPSATLEPAGGGFGLGPALRTGAALSALGASAVAGVGVRLLNRNKRAGANVATAIGPSLALGVAGIDLAVDGEEHLWSHRPAVFAFNHQSGLDMLIVGKLIGQDVTGVAKVEASRDPRFAPVGFLLDIAYVDRGNSKQARKAVEPVLDKLAAGTSIAIAPEGTRSVSDRLGPFKKGAFHIAMQAGVPVVPIVIRNAGELMWRNSFWLRPGTVDVRVLEPISTRRWKAETMDDHVAAVRKRFLDALADWD